MTKSNFTLSQKELIKKFNQMLDKGDMSFEKTDCLCGYAKFIEIAKYDRFGFPQRTVVCEKCGLMMSNPRLTDNSYKLFYSKDIYRTIYQGKNYLELAKDRFNNDHNKYLFNDLSPALKGNKDLNILEFGCGGGWNLLHFSKAGYKVVGYDYSPSLIQTGRTHGLDLREGTIKDIEGEYDIIILNHVIEHFTDFFGSMKNLIKHLKPEGLMYIGVPNIDNYGLGQLQNAHTYYFTPRTFKYFMSRCGLNTIKFGVAQKIHMYGIFDLGSPSTDISDLEPEPKRIIKRVRRAQIKEGIGKILRKIGVNEFIKSTLRMLSPKK
jgi:2-polyprenyl-3-methyl-5-hydroxy-6-metoxy-1,4-benzoquinol methylase